MSRKKERRRSAGDSKRRRSQLPASLEQVNLNAAGIDIGATEHWVAVPEDRDSQPVRKFGAFTADLYSLAEHLLACGIDTVVMESTGVYWIPLMEVLEERGFEVKLVDPHRLRQVPGRKSDVLDCQWLQQLHTFGLLGGAFRPDDQICVLRSYLRQRAMLVSYAGQHIQHMQKAMTQMNIKLQHVVSDITGATGMRIIRAILEGEQDPKRLAQMRDGRCKNSEATIAKALEGHWREEHLFELRQAVELFDIYHQKVGECDQKIETYLEGFEDQSGGQTPPKKAKEKQTRTGLGFDARSHLFRMTGVDLTAIEGIQAHTALKVIGEIGLDMTRWPNSKHFASWLGLCPGSKITGGKQLSSRSKASANRAASALRFAANGLHNSHSSLGAFLRRKKGQIGRPEAITATAHKLARIIYSMLRYGTEYAAKSQDYYETEYRKRVLKNLKRNAKRLGFSLLPLDRGSLQTEEVT